MKAIEIYKNLKAQAKKVEDKENTILYVSDTVSQYIRNQIKELVEKQIETTLYDYELGIIDEDTALDEIIVEKLIRKSL